MLTIGSGVGDARTGMESLYLRRYPDNPLKRTEVADLERATSVYKCTRSFSVSDAIAPFPTSDIGSGKTGGDLSVKTYPWGSQSISDSLKRSYLCACLARAPLLFRGELQEQ